MRFECFQRYLTLKPVREWTWKEYQIETDGVLRTQRKAPYIGHGKDRDNIFELGQDWDVTAMPPEYYAGQRGLIPRDEPDMETGSYKGIEYLILRSGYGTFCGYIQLPSGYPIECDKEAMYRRMDRQGFEFNYYENRVVGFNSGARKLHAPLCRGRLVENAWDNNWYKENHVCIDETFQQIQEMISKLRTIEKEGAGV